MKPLQAILMTAARSQKTIVLYEGRGPRVIDAALRARAEGVARLIVLDCAPGDHARLTDAGIACPQIDDAPLTQELGQLYHDLRRHKGLTLDAAMAQARLPHVHAASLVKAGHADGCLGGAVLPSAEVIRTAIQIIGRASGVDLVSSFFLMLFCASHHSKKGAHVFADAGLVVDPTASELCDIAIRSAQSFHDLTGAMPRVAMLSFSTRGSAEHAAVSKVRQATDMIRAARPDLMVDGELQFDAAFVPDVARSKAADSPLGGAIAIGPVLQGLSRPANDL